MHNKMKRRDY